jgi:CHAT domain-containing protein/tetratricopeptide (TPR) repeat protein
MRACLGVVAWLVVATVGLTQEKPLSQAELAKKPMYERLLKGEDAKTAAKLKKQIADLEATDNLEEAIKSAKELLTLIVRVQGADHHETDYKYEVSRLETLSALSAEQRKAWRSALREATAAISLDKSQSARGYPALKRLADMCGELFGEDHAATAASYDYVASNLTEQGKKSEAGLYQRKALEIRRKILGEDHPNTAKSYDTVAVSLKEQGKAAEAEPLVQKALEIYRRVRGEEHRSTALCYYHVAANLDAQGKVSEAGLLFKKTLDLYHKVFGENHPDLAPFYGYYAFNLRRQGKTIEAATYFQKSLDINRKVFGEEHPDTIHSYILVADFLNSQGKMAEADPLLRKVLDIRRKSLGEEHPDTASSYNSLAQNLHEQGKAAEAGPLFRKALDINRRILGEFHTDTAVSYNGLANSLLSQGKAVEAEQFLRKALDINRKVLGEEHQVTVTSYNNVAVILLEQGKSAQAGLLLQQILNINRKTLGEDHPDTALSYNNVGMYLHGQGKAAEAVPLLLKALDINRKIYGEDHPKTATNYNNVAINLIAQGKAGDAGTHFQKALEIKRKVLGENHPDTASGYNNLAFSLIAMGEHQKAVAAFTAAIPAFESARLATAKGIDRANLDDSNPRLILATLQQARDPAAAWKQLELSLARGLLDQQGTVGTSRLTSNEQRDQTAARARLSAIQPSLLKLVSATMRSSTETQELDQLLAERSKLEDTLGRLAVAESERAVESPDRIRAALPADAALLYWVDLESPSIGFHERWACVVRSTGDSTWERLPGTGPEGKWTKDDNALPKKFRTALAGTKTSDEIALLAKQLHSQRIAPVLKHLTGVKTLHVIPVDQMAGIPVETLTSDFTINYVPTGTYLVRVKDRPLPTGRQLLALGDPHYDTGETKPATAPKPLPPGGILVTQVVVGSIGAKARLQPGDVLLKYNDTELTDLDSLKAVIAANEKNATNTVTIWRESAEKPIVREVAPGRLGVMIYLEPAPVAIAARRKTEAMLASIRGGEWTDLPGTRVETNRLQQLFGDTAKVLTDGAASEQSLESLRKSGELAKYRYLHFATHGDGNNAVAFESALILSQDKLPKDNLPKAGEPWINGQLSAREVLDFWKLDAELVTLSACETAVGKKGGGDGMLGFAQAFLTAGARSVCLSLWKVDDTATALLMSRFYENLLGKREGLTKPMGKAVALDEAKRWLRNLSGEEAAVLTAKISNGVARGARGKNVDLKVVATETKDAMPFAHPKYWAAFILIGDPN